MLDNNEARAFAAARDLIAEHGPGAAAFLQAKIDTLTASRDFEELTLWFAIRNAVSITLKSGATGH